MDENFGMLVAWVKLCPTEAAKRIKELEDRLKHKVENANNHINQLEEQNKALLEQLTEFENLKSKSSIVVKLTEEQKERFFKGYNQEHGYFTVDPSAKESR